MAKKKGLASILPLVAEVGMGVAGGIKGVKDSPAGASQPGAFIGGMGKGLTGGFKSTPASSVGQANKQSQAKATLDTPVYKLYSDEGLGGM